MKYVKNCFIWVRLIFSMALGISFLKIGNICRRLGSNTIYEFFVNRAVEALKTEYRCVCWLTNQTIEDFAAENDSVAYLYQRGYLDL